MVEIANKTIGVVLSLKDNFGKGLTKAFQGIFKIKKDVSQVTSGINSMKNSAKSLTSTIMKVSGAFVGFSAIKGAVSTFKDFEQSMANTGAIAGVAKGSQQYKDLEEAALAAGRSTSKTAKEAADALGYMSLAGWNANESMSGLMPILRLSEATQSDLAYTSDLVTDSMSALGIKVGSLEKYLDVAAKANNKSNQTATQLMEAYIGVGGTFKNFNTEIEESSALLGVLANRGIKGSEAGNKMSSTLINLTKQSGESYDAMKSLGISAYDSKGKFKGVTNVLKELNNKTKELKPKQKQNYFTMIGGKTQIDTLNALMEGLNTTNEKGVSELQELQTELENSTGSLDTMADAINNTMTGAMARLNSAVDDFKITMVKQLEPFITPVINRIANCIPIITTKLSEAASKAKNFGASFGNIKDVGVIKAFSPMLKSIIAKLPKFFGENVGGAINKGLLNVIIKSDQIYEKLKPKIQFIKTTAKYFATNLLFGIQNFLNGQDLASSFKESLWGLKGILASVFDGNDKGLKIFTGIEATIKYVSEIIKSLKSAFVEIKSAYSKSFGEITNKLKTFAIAFLNAFSSGKGNAGVTTVNLLKNAIIAIEPIITNMLIASMNVCTFIVNNWRTIVPIAISIGMAIKTIQMVKLAIEITKATKTFSLLHIAKLRDKADTLYLNALYAKDAIVKGLSTAATWAHNAAVGTWNVICAVSTAVTTAFSAALTFLTSPIGLVIIAITAAIAIGVLLYKNWDKVKAGLVKIFIYIKEKVTEMVESFAEKFPNAFKAIKIVFDRFKKDAEVIAEAVKKIFGGISKFFKSIFSGDFSGAWEGIKQVFSGLFDIICTLISQFVFVVSNLVDMLKNKFIEKFNEIREKVAGIIMGLAEKFPGVFEIIKVHLEIFKQNVAVVIESVKTIFHGIIDFITGIFSGDWSKAWNGVKEIFSGIFNGLGGIIQNCLNGTIKLMNKAFDSVSKLKLPEWLPGIGGKSLSISHIPEIKAFAIGTQYFTGGLAKINERGGEIVNLPNGSKVIPSDKSSKMLNKNNVTINVNVNGGIFDSTESANKIANFMAQRIMLAIRNT